MIPWKHLHAGYIVRTTPTLKTDLDASTWLWSRWGFAVSDKSEGSPWSTLQRPDRFDILEKRTTLLQGLGKVA